MAECLSVPPECSRFVSQALQVMAPNSRLSVLLDMTGGRSGAHVMMVDIQTPANTPSKVASGQYILKIDKESEWNAAEPTEAERHRLVAELDCAAEQRHVPDLAGSFRGEGRTAILYCIAGGNLAGLITAEGMNAAQIEKRVSQVSVWLLACLGSEYEIDAQVSARRSLEDWLTYRLDPQQAPTLHEYARHETGGGPAFTIGGRILINPLWFCDTTFARQAMLTRFIGLLHGDLHSRNVLFSLHDAEEKQFWVIDFALSRRGPLGYDQAYWELDLLLQYLSGVGPERMLGILDAACADEGTDPAKRVPISDYGLVHAIHGARRSIDQWWKLKEPARLTATKAQTLLARVAAALNFVNKSTLSENDRRLAFAYGAKAAHEYMEAFFSHDTSGIINTLRIAPPGGSASSVQTCSNERSPQAWMDLWEKLNRFDSTNAKFVLVTGACEPGHPWASLGLLPWSAIIDFDPESSENGLHSIAAPLLSQLRSVIQYGRQPLQVSFERGTAWAMANGWPSRSESVPASLPEWRRDYLPVVRVLCEDMRRAIAPERVKVLVLPGRGLTSDRLTRLLETVDEVLRDMAEVIILDARACGEVGDVGLSLDMTPSEFVSCVQAMYGSTSDAHDPELPGIDGPVKITARDLRNIEEDFDVLHSMVLQTSANDIGNQDEFWRGNPPTWADLQFGEDIRRDIADRLSTDVSDLLKGTHSGHVNLYHSPGAGGTTAALRTAWDLRTQYPVAVLRRFSKWTPDRLNVLYKLCQKPVLMVADASLMSEEQRVDLIRELASQHSKIVVLHTIRTTGASGRHGVGIVDPLGDSEAEKFRKAYCKRTNDLAKRHHLDLITASQELRLRNQRSPFFYGLITYGRDYDGLDRYVGAHIRGIAYRPRKVLLYLALITRFSQFGMSEAMLLDLLEMDKSLAFDIESSFGTGPAKLILRHGRDFKLSHALVAEEVLRQLLGGSTYTRDGWRDALAHLCKEFIRDVKRVCGEESDRARELLQQVFISRNVWGYAPRAKTQFSEIIQAVPGRADQHLILKELTEQFPNEPHYWNHLGRHHIYSMEGDFQKAEDYLKKAIQLAPGDGLQYHTLGMVRRFWITYELKELSRKDTKPTPCEVVDKVQPLVDLAAECFSKSRELAPESSFSYITHVQMILTVAEGVLKAANAFSLGEMQDIGSAGEWLRQQIVLAEDLLARVSKLDSFADSSSYERRCQRGLNKVYGQHGEIIANWTRLLTEAADKDNVRRILASAYLAKNRRSWGAVPRAELQSISDLMRDNLSEDPTNEHDLRIWFQAFRRLPEFTYLDALGRLESWAARSDSVEAYYYLYILHFLLWRAKIDRDETNLMAYLRKCKKLAVGRRTICYEWLALRPDWCPIANRSELGGWDRVTMFYRDRSMLTRVQGSIERIEGGHAGSIRIGEAVSAFWPPSDEFRAPQDINAIVNFYLGFSYDGLRAWKVERGPIGSREMGRISEWNGTYGYIRADLAGDEVFVHLSDVQVRGLTKLDVGQKVSFERKEGPKGSRARFKAKLVRLD